MLSVVFKNPDLAAKKLGCTRASIYSWLNGHTPTLASMMKVYEIYEFHMTLAYMYDFFTLIQHLLRMDSLEDMLYRIKISALDSSDKEFLGEYFKNKFWKNHE